MRLTSPTQLSSNLIYESANPSHVSVVDDGNQQYFERITGFVESKVGFTVKYENDLAPDDFGGNMTFIGKGSAFGFDMLKDHQLPFTFDSSGFHLGSYFFPFSEFGLRAILPNPHNPQNYLVLNLSSDGAGGAPSHQWTDFTVSKVDTVLQKMVVVFDGFFDKSDPAERKFADSLTTAFADLKSLCPGGVCPVPSLASSAMKTGTYEPQFSGWSTTDFGQVAEIGNRNCRFPSIAAGADGRVATVWEEDGDIVMALVGDDQAPSFITVERELSDSFNPLVIWDDESFLIVYLNDKKGRYRVYGRYYTDGRLSSEFPISNPGSFDAITPAIAADNGGRIAVTWTEWKANYRWPKYRIIENRVLGEIRDLHIRETGTNDYVNAWCPSILYDRDGQLQGAWNQHYPTMLGVCAGDLINEAALLTGEGFEGYPSLIEDSSGQLWTFWESSLLGMYRAAQPQQIQFATHTAESEAWTIPTPISIDSQTTVNQTPRACVGDDGTISVVWSGRKIDDDLGWQIYMASYHDGTWTFPERISYSDGPHRAPDICSSDDGSLWVTWHSGAGEQMKITLLRR